MAASGSSIDEQLMKQESEQEKKFMGKRFDLERIWLILGVKTKIKLD
jgi:hypothetical protein